VVVVIVTALVADRRRGPKARRWRAMLLAEALPWGAESGDGLALSFPAPATSCETCTCSTNEGRPSIQHQNGSLPRWMRARPIRLPDLEFRRAPHVRHGYQQSG
jgi:hypothetical protein